MDPSTKKYNYTFLIKIFKVWIIPMCLALQSFIQTCPFARSRETIIKIWKNLLNFFISTSTLTKQKDCLTPFFTWFDVYDISRQPQNMLMRF